MSFEGMRGRVERPVGVEVSYVNEEGDEIEEDLYDFSARMFLHEFDHLQGLTLIHWYLTQSHLQILSPPLQRRHQDAVHPSSHLTLSDNKVL